MEALVHVLSRIAHSVLRPAVLADGVVEDAFDGVELLVVGEPVTWPPVAAETAMQRSKASAPGV